VALGDDYNRACVAARFGLNNLAKTYLQQAKIKEPQSFASAWTDPDLRSLRRHHWFRRLIQQ